jgi:hypothetical protein
MTKEEMDVTYTFRQDSYEVFPPFTYHIQPDKRHSFHRRSLILLYEYVNRISKLHVTPTQFTLYDTMGNMINEMVSKVIVYIESPIQTVKYYSDDYLEYMKKENQIELSDFPLTFYWITVPPLDADLFTIQDYEINDLVFNGISRINGILKEHYIIKHYEPYLMTTSCRKRYEFLLNKKAPTYSV